MRRLTLCIATGQRCHAGLIARRASNPQGALTGAAIKPPHHHRTIA